MSHFSHQRSSATELTTFYLENKLCAWRHNMPPPLQVDNIFVFIRQVAQFRHIGYYQQQVDL